MTGINFRQSVVEQNIQINKGELYFDPDLYHSNPPEEVKQYPIGTQRSDVLDMMTAVREGTRSTIPIPENFGNLKTTVRTYWMKDAADFNGDGKTDFLLLRTAVIPQGDFRSTTVSWLVAVLDDGDGNVSADEEKAGIVIASGMMAGELAPIRDVTVDGSAANGVPEVRYTKFDQDTCQYNRYSSAVTTDKLAPDHKADTELILSALRYYDAVLQAPETSYVKMFIRKEFGKEVELVEPSKLVAIPEVLRPLYSGLKAAQANYDAGIYGKKDLVGTLNDVFLAEADKMLVLSSEEIKYRVDTLRALTEQFAELEGKLEWNGVKMSRPKYEEMMESENNEATRIKMAENYEANFSPMYAENGPYHKFIEHMNEIARKHGFNNYAEMRIKENFGMDMASFKKWVAETFKATEKDAQAFIAELKGFSGEEGLDYWGVVPTRTKRLLSLTGMEKVPEITEKNALAILKQFYKDLGFDMGSAPYNRTTIDAFLDPLKFNRPGVAATATPTYTYFTSNLEPGKTISLRNFETLVHELMHTMHYQTSGQVGQGYSIYQNGMPSYVAESLTTSTQDMTAGTPLLMKKYYGDIPGFDNEKLFKEYPEMKKKEGAWLIRRLLTMALMEINLYENTGAWKDRLAAWEPMVRQNLFVEPKGIKYGQIMCRTHPYDEQSQLNYAGYPLGNAAVKRIRDAIVKTGVPEELAKFGQVIKRIMIKGATANQKTLMDEVNAAEKGAPAKKRKAAAQANREVSQGNSTYFEWHHGNETGM